MSKPDRDIIHSQEAQMFLRSVTEGFYNRSCLALWMFEVIGREWDEMAAWSNDLKQEIYVQTCTWSIAIWEWVYGFEPDESMTLEERRQRILSKVRGVRPINPEVMRRGIAAVSGADAGLKDFSNPFSFSVTMSVTNKPIPIERVLRFIYETKPAHLAVSVEVIFPTIESTLHVGGAAGNSTIITVPMKLDTYDFRNTLYTAGAAGAAASIIVPQKRDKYDFCNTLHTGGTVGAAASINTPQRPDDYDFQSALRTGGSVESIASADIVAGKDHYDFQETIRTGGKFSGRTLIQVQENTEQPPASSGLRTGGGFSSEAVLSVLEGTTSPPATTILRTGGVCTIFSNLPPKGE